MINVLYISNQRDFLGGAERSLFELITNIDKEQVTPYFASSQDGELCSAIKDLGIEVLQLKPFHIRKPAPIVPITADLISFIRKNKIQIIHNNQCVDSYYSWLAGKITRTPIINHLRDTQYYRLDRFLIKHVDCNICISNDLYNRFSASNVALIHNGIRLDQFLLDHRPNRDGQEIVRVGLVGRIAPQKGQDTFIKAAKLVLDACQNVRFEIYGDINSETSLEYKKQLRSLPEELNISEFVKFMGYAHNVANALNNLHISVVPSLREPFGRVVIESMASYLPVIGTRVGGIPDIITNETGVLVEPNNPSALAEAILFLVENPSIRRKMGEAGRVRVEEYFTIDKVVSKIMTLYKDLSQSH
ncbi:MAG: glycosyltransferase family 4 protein [Anaerolineales bacterium]|jgi:glycosyltransferase involved in cell wall biosynthesis|nr:glycosyltransferase family 4 protein [Anaerolineales bacterium]